EAVLAGELKRLRSGVEAGDADRRTGALQRAQMMAERAEHRPRHVDAPEFPLVLETAIGLPDLEHDPERFARHVAIDALHPVDAEQLPVAGEAARADTQHVAAFREVIHEGHAAGELG